MKPAAPATAATPADASVKNAPAPGKPVPAVPVAKPAFVIQSLTATRSNKYLKALVYGRPGVGKTSFCGSAVDLAGMRDVLLLSVEQGSMSLHDNPRIKNPELIDEISAVNFKVCSTVKDFLAAHCILRDQGNDEKLWELQRKYMPGVEDRLRKYRTVIIDSLSEIETLNMYDLLSVNPDANAALAGEMPVAEFKEYKQNNNKMQLLIRAIKNLPMNVFMTCAEAWEQDEMKRYHFTPSLTGKLSGQIQGFFDIVGYLQAASPTEDKEAPRRLWVQPVGGRFDAKTRLASLKKPYFDDPVVASIMAAAGLAQ